MKKILLSLAVIFGFLIYAEFEKSGAAGNNNLSPTAYVAPKNESSGPASSSSSAQSTGRYKDGTYTGPVADAFYGNVQVQATVQGGRIADVKFLQYPNDRGHSIMINMMAMPQLTSEAITAQNAQVDIVSGATDTSNAFMESLASALTQAQ